MKDPQEQTAQSLLAFMARIADTLESSQASLAALAAQSAPATVATPDWRAAPAYVWDPRHNSLRPVTEIAAPPLDLLVGLTDHATVILQNTRQFAAGYPANNALLWGARGMGKSTLVKAVFEAVRARHRKLRLIEVHRDDIETLPDLLHILRPCVDFRFILYCDDLSFDDADATYRALKTVLEGGLEARPAHIILYATSNRRHLVPRHIIENEQDAAIHSSEALEEKVSLSDRFGLSLGFYPCDQEQYLTMVERYAKSFDLRLTPQALHAEALRWSMERGARSGRVAWQFINDLAGRHKKKQAP